MSFYVYSADLKDILSGNVSPGSHDLVITLGVVSKDVRDNFSTSELNQFYDLCDRMEMLVKLAQQRQQAAMPAHVPPPPGTVNSIAVAKAAFQASHQQASNQYANALDTTMAPPRPTGHNCTRCRVHNEYAQANMPDGTYLCYGCRP